MPPWTFTGVARLGLHRTLDIVAFLGESLAAAATLPRHRRHIRIGDLFRIADQAGGQAIPLVVLLGYLMGLILAFQSSIPLRRFGADLFVVNLVGLSLLRELGPLLAAVILAGRTGSAFAAEIGTMKVNEEVAALQTLGISPMTMLVLPRLGAAVLVMPVLTLFLELAGLCGMLTVMMAFGFPPTAVATQLGRAAAVEQLQIWGERVGAPVIAGPPKADAAGLAFEACKRARMQGADLLLIDTAGRLHNKGALMEELAKIIRVLRKFDPAAPHSVLLVLDATTGQNALEQVRVFRELVSVTGLVVTKLDGSARGGVVVALADAFGLPLHAVGVGEQAEDLRPFSAAEFARGLVGDTIRLAAGTRAE